MTQTHSHSSHSRTLQYRTIDPLEHTLTLHTLQDWTVDPLLTLHTLHTVTLHTLQDWTVDPLEYTPYNPMYAERRTPNYWPYALAAALSVTSPREWGGQEDGGGMPHLALILNSKTLKPRWLLPSPDASH